MVQAVYLSLLFLEGWTHWSPLPVGIHHIPSCSLAARFPSGWWGKLEGVGAAGGGGVANRLLDASTDSHSTSQSSTSLDGSTWQLICYACCKHSISFWDL